MVLGFYGFVVIWLYGFILWFCGLVVSWSVVVWSYGFIVLWRCGFMVSKNYQVSMSCFREDIDPISKIFEISLDGSSGLFGPRLFPNR